jgi:hypothetical protein
MELQILKRFVFGLFSLFLIFSAQAQEIKKKKLKKTLLPVPTIGTSPETGFYAGAVATLDMVPVNDSTARHSLISTEISYTERKQFIVSGSWDLTNKNRDFIIFGENSWMKFTEFFWGIGGKTAEENELLYGTYRLELENGFYKRIGENTFAGIDQQLQSVYSLQLPQANENNLGTLKQITSGITSGFGLGYIFDTRSALLNPRPGESMFMIHGLYFGKIFGSDFEFPHVHIDARIYLPFKWKSTLALQATTELFGKNAPYLMNAQLGGSMMMRGFYQGRFRDNNQVTAQAEFRLPIWRWIGATTFASMGDVFSFQNSERNGKLKSAAGLGLRICVDKKEKTNLRFDYAITSDRSTGFYISFGEAF